MNETHGKYLLNGHPLKFYYQLCCLTRQGKVGYLMASHEPEFVIDGAGRHVFKNLWVQRSDQPAVKKAP